MRVLLQRVQQASVTVSGHIVGQVDEGFVALVGVTHGDGESQVHLLARKTAHLRVFEDDEGRMNRSILETSGGILVVSQFTLYADARKGRRPGFSDAATPEHAAPLVEAFARALQELGVARVARGIFGASMQIALINDGPVTIWLDSDELAG
jgi:D-tyrosyl-tRNA(Tyr) deacylase